MKWMRYMGCIFASEILEPMKKIKSDILDAYKGQPIARTMYVATWVFAILMLVAGFCCIPLGEIHHSVLVGTGMMLMFTLVGMAILNDKSVTISGDLDDKEVSISLGKEEKKNEE